MTDNGEPLVRGPVEIEVLRFVGTLGSLGGLRSQAEPDYRVAQLVATACERQLALATSRDGPVERAARAITPGDPTAKIEYHEAYCFTLFPVFFASMRAGGAHARELAVCLLVYSRMAFRKLAVDSTGQADAFDLRWKPDLWEASLSGLFVSYARLLDRDGGRGGRNVGHAVVQWITGVSDSMRSQHAASVVATWMNEQIDDWSERLRQQLQPAVFAPEVSPDAITAWLNLLPGHIRLTKQQIDALEAVRRSLGASTTEFAFHLAGHPECSRMAQRQVYAHIQAEVPGGPVELHLALLLRSRLLAAKMSGGDLFGLVRRSAFDTDELTEADLVALRDTLANRQLTSLDLLLDAIAKEEDALPQTPSSPQVAAAIVRITSILRGRV